jgi:molybdopterin-guanine dinucleotide biosynthesis protein A
MQHSAALIAGGKSTRMGRDKAALIYRGCPLWRHQLSTLSATSPAELFVAGACAAIPPGETLVIPDENPDSGPLGGIATALAHSSSPWTLVLAVDMPAMPATYLSALVAHAAATGRGAVPMLDARWEPLAAIYPAASLAIARELLAAQRLAMREFLAEAKAQGLIDTITVAAHERPYFANINTPADAASLL